MISLPPNLPKISLYLYKLSAETLLPQSKKRRANPILFTFIHIAFILERKDTQSFP